MAELEVNRMKFNTFGDTDNPLIDVRLERGERIKLESGAMAYMQNVELEGELNSNGSRGIGGFFKALGRSLVSGEGLFITKAVGAGENGRIGIAPAVPGVVRKLEIGERQYRLNTGSFLACDDTITYNMKKQEGLGKILFGGTGGIFVMETSGYGDLLVNAFGDMVTIEVTDDAPLIIDNEHVVAWDTNLDYQIRPASGVIGFKTGEGLVNEFHGNGKVLIQTRNVHNLANTLIPYLPSNTTTVSTSSD